MKNITLSIDDETHRQARIRAAEMGTSVSALVRGFLQSLSSQPGDAAPSLLQTRRRILDAVWDDFDNRGVGLRASENLSREELYEEAVKSADDDIR